MNLYIKSSMAIVIITFNKVNRLTQASTECKDEPLFQMRLAHSWAAVMVFRTALPDFISNSSSVVIIMDTRINIKVPGTAKCHLASVLQARQ